MRWIVFSRASVSMFGNRRWMSRITLCWISVVSTICPNANSTSRANGKIASIRL